MQRHGGEAGHPELDEGGRLCHTEKSERHETGARVPAEPLWQPAPAAVKYSGFGQGPSWHQACLLPCQTQPDNAVQGIPDPGCKMALVLLRVCCLDVARPSREGHFCSPVPGALSGKTQDQGLRSSGDISRRRCLHWLELQLGWARALLGSSLDWASCTSTQERGQG